MTMVSSSIRKTRSATEQIYYRRHGGYYRRGYAYGPRYYHGRPVHGYGYGYPYAHPVVPVPLPVPFFGWGADSREFFGVQGGGSSDSRCRPPKKSKPRTSRFFPSKVGALCLSEKRKGEIRKHLELCQAELKSLIEQRVGLEEDNSN
jgi:hypothetical protein